MSNRMQPHVQADDSIPQMGVITCAVMDREVAAAVRDNPRVVRVEHMQQGLHNDPPLLRDQLQIAVQKMEQDERIDTIALVYGLCSRGTEGITAKRCRLVIARAHDCITLLLGSKERYAQYVADHPGTYWYSPGWNEHHTPPGPDRYHKLKSEYTQKYGQDNAEFLMESEQHWFSTYNRATYVHLTVGRTEPDVQYTQDCADWLKWDYEEIAGNPNLLQRLINGPWDDDAFLVIEPGQTMEMSADEGVIRIAKPNPDDTPEPSTS